jgi:hypothetical protein
VSNAENGPILNCLIHSKNIVVNFEVLVLLYMSEEPRYEYKSDAADSELADRFENEPGNSLLIAASVDAAALSVVDLSKTYARIFKDSDGSKYLVTKSTRFSTSRGEVTSYEKFSPGNWQSLKDRLESQQAGYEKIKRELEKRLDDIEKEERIARTGIKNLLDNDYKWAWRRIDISIYEVEESIEGRYADWLRSTDAENLVDIAELKGSTYVNERIFIPTDYVDQTGQIAYPFIDSNGEKFLIVSQGYGVGDVWKEDMHPKEGMVVKGTDVNKWLQSRLELKCSEEIKESLDEIQSLADASYGFVISAEEFFDENKERSWPELAKMFMDALGAHSDASSRMIEQIRAEGNLSPEEILALQNEAAMSEWEAISTALPFLSLSALSATFKSGGLDTHASLDEYGPENITELFSPEGIARVPLVSRLQELGRSIEANYENLISHEFNSNPVFTYLLSFYREDLQKLFGVVTDDSIRSSMDLRDLLWNLDSMHQGLYWKRQGTINYEPNAINAQTGNFVSEILDKWDKLFESQIVPRFGTEGNLIRNLPRVSTVAAGLFVTTRELIDVMNRSGREEVPAFLYGDLPGMAGRFSLYYIREHDLAEYKERLTADPAIESLLKSVRHKGLKDIPHEVFDVVRKAKELAKPRFS